MRPWSELVELYRLIADLAPPNLPARYNIAPTQDVPIVRERPDEAGRELVLVRWGLVPPWAKDPGGGVKCINARAETLAERPSFRNAFRQRRCLVPADGFYEWRAEQGRKQPYHITLPEDRPFAFAGLWERWRGGEGETVESCAIIVCAANGAVRAIHDRMPVILAPEQFDAWLDARMDPAAARALLAPYPGPLAITRVSPRVNNVRNDDGACRAPLAEAAPTLPGL